MDTILMVVTALSLAMATGLALVVVKLLREERARSEARVAALAAMSSNPIMDVACDPVLNPVPHPRPQAPHSRPAREIALAELEIRPSAEAVAGVGTLFAPHDEPSPWGRRLGVIAAVAAVILATGVVAASIRRHPSRPAAAAIAQQGPGRDVVPLELLSLHHMQESDRLIITGVVQNPRNGAAVARVSVTASLFGADGGPLASGVAPLDFTSLAPGVESPFVVIVPVVGAVSRYRVGFRTEDGRVVSHVDRRAPEALAQK